MKLQFTYNTPDLDQALQIAKQTAEYADILGVGSLLIIKEGVRALEAFRKEFPNKQLCSEIKITEKADQAVALMAQAGAHYITVLAGTFTTTIKKAVEAAKKFDVKVALDLLDAPSIGQSAMDAKTLGADIVVLHQQIDTTLETNGINDDWLNVKDNTKVPIFITGKVNQENFGEIIKLRPHGIMIGTAITKADNPAKAAHFFRSQIL